MRVMDLQEREYRKSGYFFAKEILTEEDLSGIRESVSRLSPKVFIPYSNVPWGYGNLIDNSDFISVIENKKIVEFCNKILGKDKYCFNHIMINNKAPWIGTSFEWHQEASNIDTYAPGYHASECLDNFIQIYIAIDKHTLDNGCLRIIPESHKEGLLPHEDIMIDRLAHKKRVPHATMTRIHEKCGYKPIVMNAGDVVFFNHLLIHGSSTNHSPFERRSIVIQARRLGTDRDEKTFARETSRRTEFVIRECEEKLRKLKEKNPYLDFNGGKK